MYPISDWAPLTSSANADMITAKARAESKVIKRDIPRRT